MTTNKDPVIYYIRLTDCRQTSCNYNSHVENQSNKKVYFSLDSIRGMSNFVPVSSVYFRER